MAVLERNLQEAQRRDVLQLAYAESEVGLRTADGRSERILLKTASPTDFVVDEPQVQANGDVRMDLEILKFELVGESEVLWPGSTIRIYGGVEAAAGNRPIYGHVHIPAGKSMEDGVPSEQVLYLTVETPIGKLHNEQPIRMVGDLYRVPPVGSRFASTDEVPMLNEEGDVAVTFWGCANEA